MKGTKSVYLVGMRNWEKWEKDKIVNKRTANILSMRYLVVKQNVKMKNLEVITSPSVFY